MKTVAIERRAFFKSIACIGLYLCTRKIAWSKTYLTIDQAKQALCDTTDMIYTPVPLTKPQQKAIAKISGVRVRKDSVEAWRTRDGDWFIRDEVLGKHENIDLAVALTKDGKVRGVEILEYRETYGHQIMQADWRAQFTGKDHTERLKLDQQIKNISGATLSCRHVTDGINRLCATWNEVLRHLSVPR